MTTLQSLLQTAEAAARAGGEVLLPLFRHDSVETEWKAENDVVSEADRASERVILETIQERHPDHDILSEEAGQVVDEDADYQWIVDPLDGTSNFVQGLPIFGVSVACSHRGRIVAGSILDPCGDNLFSAVRGGGCTWNGRPAGVSRKSDLRGSFLATGYPFRAKDSLETYLEVFRRAFSRARSIRRCGAAAIDLAHTAVGIFDGFFEFRLSAWDLAAGSLLIEEAGGVVSDLDGGDGYLASGNLLAGSLGVHRELLQVVEGVASEARLDEVSPVGGGG